MDPGSQPNAWLTGRTDCHDQSADWSRNDREREAMFPCGKAISVSIIMDILPIVNSILSKPRIG